MRGLVAGGRRRSGAGSHLLYETGCVRVLLWAHRGATWPVRCPCVHLRVTQGVGVHDCRCAGRTGGHAHKKLAVPNSPSARPGAHPEVTHLCSKTPQWKSASPQPPPCALPSGPMDRGAQSTVDWQLTPSPEARSGATLCWSAALPSHLLGDLEESWLIATPLCRHHPPQQQRGPSTPAASTRREAHLQPAS